jgi:hypothetical protein
MRLFECCYGFGDALMNVPVLKAYSESTGEKVCVATRQNNFDAFTNLDFVDKVYPIQALHSGVHVAREHGFEYAQLTQHHLFNVYRRRWPRHSLMDTPSTVARRTWKLDIDPKPVFIPTEEELAKTECFKDCQKPIVAIEAHANSSQSWSTVKHNRMLCREYLGDQFNVLWVSHVDPPNLEYVDDMKRFSRRECVAALRYCDLFLTTCSGLCVGAFGLPKEMQPKKVVMTLNRSQERVYKLQGKFEEYGFHDDLEYAWNYRLATTAIENFKENLI